MMRCTPELIAKLQSLQADVEKRGIAAREELSNELFYWGAEIVSDLVLLAQIQAKFRAVGEAATR